MTLADIFKGMAPKNGASPFSMMPTPVSPFAGMQPPSYSIFGGSAAPIAPAVPTTQVTRTLPNGQGTYQSPVISQPSAPVAPKVAPVVQSPAAPTAPAGVDYSKYTDPATGRVLSPQEYANMLASRVNGGAIPNYAGNALTQGPQTTPQLQSTATDLNNQRNDIAVGATDPYGVASKSGIAYSPTEMAAIEKAYAGIYDPALKDVFAKLDLKQKQDASDRQLKNDLALAAQKHRYDLELAGLTPVGGGSGDGTGGTGAYVPGANPVVDAWAQQVYSGQKQISDVPAALKNAVIVAVNSGGTQANGKPTTTPLGIQALATAKDLMNKFTTGKGTSAVGGSRLFGGAIAGATPGTDASNFTNDYNTLISQLSLDGSKYLKGQGQISDSERALLAGAVTKLKLSQSEDEFKSTLQSIINSLSGNATDSNVVTAPDGTQVQITD